MQSVHFEAMRLPAPSFRSNVEALTPIIGAEAAHVAVASTAWFAVGMALGWLLFLPLTVWAALGASLPVSIVAIAAVMGACCAGIWASFLRHRAGELASRHASERSGHRVRVAGQLANQERWQRAIEHAQQEHSSHLELAASMGPAPALDRLLTRIRRGNRRVMIALSLVGALGGLFIAMGPALAASDGGGTAALSVLFGATMLGALAPPLAILPGVRARRNALRSELADELDLA